MNALVAIAAAGLGISVGPVIRAAAFRAAVQTGSPPRTTCPRCDTAIVRIGRIRCCPVFSWSGRCPQCGLRIGPPVATVELITAATFATLAVTTDRVLPLLAYGWITAVGIALAIVDIAVHRLPDRLTALLAGGAATILSIEALTTKAGNQIVGVLLTGLGASLAYLVVSLITSGGVGLGDAKLAFGLGLTTGWKGWTTTVSAMTLGLVLTGLTATVLLILKRTGRKDSIPHGPFMLLAAVIAIALTVT